MNILLHWSCIPEEDLYFFIPQEDIDDILMDALQAANGHIGGLDEDPDGDNGEADFLACCEAISAVGDYVDAHHNDALAVPFAIPSNTVLFHTGVLL